MMMKRLVAIPAAALLAVSLAWAANDDASDGFVPLFNGKDFSGWKVPEGDGGHWKVVDGVIDYDAGSDAKGDKNLWSDREYGDFVLQIDWRLVVDCHFAIDVIGGQPQAGQLGQGRRNGYCWLGF